MRAQRNSPDRRSDPESPQVRRRRRTSALYVMLWGLLGSLAAGYMAILVLQPGWARSVTTLALHRESAPAQSKLTLQFQAEVEALRRAVADLQRELASMKTASLRTDKEAADGTRLTASDRSEIPLPAVGYMPVPAAMSGPPSVAAVPNERSEREASPQPVPAAAESTRAKQKLVVLNAKPAETKPVEPLTKPTEPAKPAEQPKSSDSAKTAASKLAETMETGSLPPIPQQPRIAFGPPTVKPASEPVAIVLESAPSLDALRLRWSVLHERHQSALKDLEPRYLTVGTREAPSYQLVAGPILSPDEAKRICALLRAKKVSCSVGPGFTGEAL
jgi:hypothetical protein